MTCLQIELVQAACVKYLLNQSLPPNQMRKLALLFDQLHLKVACQQAQQQLVQRVWDPEGATEIATMFAWMLDVELYGPDGLLECKQLLKDPKRGAMCEAQVV